MSLKKKIDLFFKTTTFRLTLWYLGVFSVLSLVVFLVVYASLASHLKKQTDGELTDTATEFVMLYKEHGVRALQAEFTREAESRGTRREFFQLISPDGSIAAESDASLWKDLHDPREEISSTSAKQPFFRTQTFFGHHDDIRILFMPVTGNHWIIIGRTLHGDGIMLERYRETFGSALAIMLVSSGIIGWLTARKAMAGVQRVTETASRIGRRDFGRRVSLADEGEEINALVHAFNGMLERIETLVDELRQISDDVAHELRTPLTRIRGVAETALRDGENLDDFRDMSATVISECDNLIEMINTMLEIAKNDSGVIDLDMTALDLGGIIEEAVDLFIPLAEDKHLDIRMTRPSKSVTVFGDRPRLQRVVANILDNAIKYTPSGGTVTVSLDEDETWVKVDVADTGPGIGAKDIHHIFDRFYRSDKSRSTEGSGLGLSLARAVIHAHGGEIKVQSSGHGSTFSFFLPAPLSQTVSRE